MNDDILKGKWARLKGRIKEQWGKLTDDEIDELDGRRDQLVGKVQERYGIARDQASRDVDNWLNNTAAHY
ncbi:MAG TPA: CsbD family protein [Vicinamibacterales bacterium]|nr:CsbD family protein [Vicinamibacterales bacterium]